MEKSIRDEFNDAMWGIYNGALAKYGYNATIFRRMLLQYGGEQTARRLLAESEVQSGFTELFLRGGMAGLESTVEFLVLQPKWQGLIDEAQRQEARRRLLANEFPANRLPPE